MAVSSSDIRAVLPVGAANSGPSQAPPRKPAPTKKPDGIPRELYALIGDATPTLLVQNKPRLKQKPKLGGGTKTRWEWREFKNSARQDNLQLRHWVKVSDPQTVEQEYPFAVFDSDSSPLKALKYTNEEYNQYLEDQDWPRQETDYLFSLVHDYERRWPVIYDRYEFPASTRSMEDLKDRYFSVCRKIIRARGNIPEDQKIIILNNLQFDKETEVMRKKYIISLEERTPEQKADEEALHIELKRLEQNERRFRRDREELLRMLAGIESGLADTIEDDSAMAILNSDLKRKKKGLDFETSSSAGGSVGIPKRPPPPKNAAYDAQHCITRVEPTTAPALVTKNAHTPAFLRTLKLPVPKQSVHQKVTDILKEVNVNPSRLVMPTRDNVRLFENVIDAASALAEIKKQLDKTDYDVHVLNERLKVSSGESSQTQSLKMEDNVDGEVGEDGRSQSVASARSGRSRKKTRSDSVSSVDAAGSAPKRQRRN
ncbi:hypothetical protein DL96DRAFT_1605144 [Flagelloscypha sp. PMI_526]|nr:hypothetical protein DL96DRAFT_1605144 [Flagelloscypha sp. PMI_526]